MKYSVFVASSLIFLLTSSVNGQFMTVPKLIETLDRIRAPWNTTKNDFFAVRQTFLENGLVPIIEHIERDQAGQDIYYMTFEGIKSSEIISVQSTSSPGFFQVSISITTGDPLQFTQWAMDISKSAQFIRNEAISMVMTQAFNYLPYKGKDMLLIAVNQAANSSTGNFIAEKPLKFNLFMRLRKE